MAKIMSPLVGQGKGKIGAQVLYRANGEQLIRARAIEVKNPRSNAQMAQRMAVATSAKLTAALRGIVDHSFEGVPYGEASVRFFNSKATLIIKAAINNPNRGWAPVVPGDAPIGTCPNIPLSKGSLSPVNISFEKTFAGRNGIITPTFLASEGFSSEMQLGEFLVAAGIKKADQLTFVTAKSELYDSAYNVEEQFSGLRFSFARVNFNLEAADSLPAFVEDSSGNVAFNPAVLDAEKSSNVNSIVFSNEASGLALLSVGEGYFVAAAVIRSAYVGGDWQRSNTELETLWGTFTGEGQQDGYSVGLNYYSSVLECYRKGKTATEDRYLNKEDN